ncbi:MAG TPA: hypothetical protein VFW00_07140 [Rhodocyclaceae bacterium]|nr:hypothetical protein [Rhodocyclaceae bacterium]
MTFDAKSLLTAPPMTVDALAERLAKIKMLGMGGAPVVLEGGEIGAIDLVAHGEKPAHFVVRPK